MRKRLMGNTICIVDSNECPMCGNKVDEGNEECSCGCKIRFIKKNRNPNYLRPIAKVDLSGKVIETYRNVYACYPLDNKSEKKNRDKVIDACNGKQKTFLGFQWKYIDCEAITPIKGMGSSKAIMKIDFDGQIMEEFDSITAATKKINYGANTIAKACKNHIPPQGADFFLFFKNDYSETLFQKVLSDYREHDYKIEVRDESNRLKGVYDSYSDAAKELSVSDTSIKDWCNHKYNPSGGYEGYSFTLVGKIRRNTPAFCSKLNEKCELYKENSRLLNENEKLVKSIQEAEFEIEKWKKICVDLQGKLDAREKEYSIRRERTNSRIKYMLPIEEFMNDPKYKDLFAGVAIYILVDEDGKRYVGQTLGSDGTYKRIKEHFLRGDDGTIKNQWNVNKKFFLEKVVIGWEERLPFNLDDAERYYIHLYHSDAIEYGYNKTKGNHSELAGRFDEEFMRIEKFRFFCFINSEK